MLPSFVSNLIWGEEQQNTSKEQALVEPEVTHTVCEGQDDWMVIEYSTESGEAVTENESVCSEASEQSWIVEPSPRFKPSSRTTPVLPHHSLEDLLIEHPTMSVYADRDDDYNNETKSNQTNTTTDSTTEKDPKNMQIALRNQNTQLVLVQNRTRQLMATQLGIPATPETIQQQQIDASSSKPMKTTKRQPAKPTFIRVSRGKKAFKIHQCGVKAGKRRC